MVGAAGLEPALTYVNKIFIPTTDFPATKISVCGLDFLLAISNWI
jgi:hypothetical protein